MTIVLFSPESRFFTATIDQKPGGDHEIEPGREVPLWKSVRIRGTGSKNSCYQVGLGGFSKDWEPDDEPVYRVTVRIQRDETVIQKRKEKASCFVLITSLEESEQWSHQRVFETYKDQSSVERSFAFIKAPKTIGPMYLDSPERVQALGYVLLMALLVYSLIERRVRQALAPEEEPMKLAGGKQSGRPTGRRVLERFENMMVAKDGSTRSLPDNLQIPWRVLDLLRMEKSMYGVTEA